MQRNIFLGGKWVGFKLKPRQRLKRCRGCLTIDTAFYFIKNFPDFIVFLSKINS